MLHHEKWEQEVVYDEQKVDQAPPRVPPVAARTFPRGATC
jgi:hypothetical protein